MKRFKQLIDFSNVIDEINDSKIELGYIQFGKQMHPFPVSDEFIEIGMLESDPIAIWKDTDQVVILDHEVSGRISSFAANNLCSFLSAICVIEDFFIKCTANETLFENEPFIANIVTAAGEQAGGEKYRAFYEFLIGIQLRK